MGTIEKLNAAGTAVELYKVKAHMGIVGNEGADEAAKEACEKGRMVPNTENSDTVTLQALLDQGREEERMIRQKGVKAEVTKRIREHNQTTSHRIQAYRRKLETPPEEWGTRGTGNKRRKTTQESEELEHEMEWLMREQERTTEEQEQDEQWDNEINEMMRREEEQHRETEPPPVEETEEGEEDVQEEEEETGGTGTSNRTSTIRNRAEGEREETAVEVDLRQEVEEIMRAMEEMVEEETEGEGIGEERVGGVAEEPNQTGEEERGTEQEGTTMEPQQELEEILRDLEEEATERDRRRRRQEQELERNRIKTAENTNPYRLMRHLQGDEPMKAVSNRFWKTRDARLTRIILRGRYRVMAATHHDNRRRGTRCPLCQEPWAVYAKGCLVKPEHVLGGCKHMEMRKMITKRSDATTLLIAKALRNARKGGCMIKTHAGKQVNEGKVKRPIPDWVLRRGQCRMDGRDQPGPGHGGDTIPHCVDIFMVEGTEMHRAGYNYTQERAKRDVKMIHLIEVTYTQDTEWEKALKDKYVKYAPLVKLLESNGFKAMLHVIVIGHTGTIYEHSNRALTKHLGFNKQEAAKLLAEIHKTATGFAKSIYTLYRERVDKHPKEPD
ncbi:hypothetical protein CYMTET_3236 [Cymbomonas tetramitiformis]|uniref:RNase H type-1 domain-containing protein n=1 Tax=Cymbomonas tetramitiformis TaxID=36881 RepID=A0AAE0LLB0_9CHLO|nr:hypothetical protein CYMTET_3236 [Cymbomonas tetramitiformis]